MSKKLLIAAFVAGTLSQLLAQTQRLGPEFQINVATTGYQESPRVSWSSAGGFVVVWHDQLRDGSGFGVVGRRFDGSGVPLGPEFQVNTYTTGSQWYPALATDRFGQFVVAWNSVQDGSVRGVYAQRFDGSGNKVGSEFRVNTYTTNEQLSPSVDYDGTGNFVVAWDSGCGSLYPCVGQDGEYSGVFGQRYTGAGAPSGSEFRINTYTREDQTYPTVGKADAGSFVVVWQSYQDGSGQGPFNYGIIAQRYTSAGVKTGPDFEVNTYTPRDQTAPAIAVNGAGNFVVVWESEYQDGSGLGVFAQRYNSSGTKIGSEFRVNTYTTSDQGAPSVAIDNSGNFVVVWRSSLQDGWASGIFGQRYNSDGTQRGVEFRANTYTPRDQRVPSVDMDPSTGNFVVVWSSVGPDGSATGVCGQRFSANNCTPSTPSTPPNQTACPGATVLFTETPTGLSPFTYQWRKNGVNLLEIPGVGGTKTATLKLSQVSAASAGSYSCTITDSCLPPASATSGGGTLTVASNGSLPPVVTNLRVQRVGGASLLFTWNNAAGVTDYILFQDSAPDGGFPTVSGTGTSGVTGLTIPVPANNTFYLISGRNANCGIGP